MGLERIELGTGNVLASQQFSRSQFSPGNTATKIVRMSTAAPSQAASVPSQAPHQPRLASVNDVEIFATGLYRGKRWTCADLAEIVKNFDGLGPNGKNLLTPPNVIGHEEGDLDKTDLPAIGKPSKVWMVPYKDRETGQFEAVLKANFSEMPEGIVRLIKSGAYKKISAEIYDNFTDDFGNGYGKALRRVALLGGEIPQVKRLADIPTNFFAEREPARYPIHARTDHTTQSRIQTGGRLALIFHVFAEVKIMDRTAAIAAIKAGMPGIDQGMLDSMTDEQLLAIASNLPPMAEPVAEYADMPATKEELIASLTAMGQDATALATMGEEDLKALWKQLKEGATPMSDANRTQTAGTTAATSTGTTPVRNQQTQSGVIPNAQPQSVTLKYAEADRQAQKALDLANATITRLEAENKKAADRARAQKLQDAEKFCETLIADPHGARILPTDKPLFVEMLMNRDDSSATHKFSDGGKDTMITPFEALKRDLAKRPVAVVFGEKIKGTGATDTNEELNKVIKFAEAHAETFKGIKLVDNFKAIQAKNPKATALQYIGKEVDNV